MSAVISDGWNRYFQTIPQQDIETFGDSTDIEEAVKARKHAQQKDVERVATQRASQGHSGKNCSQRLGIFSFYLCQSLPFHFISSCAFLLPLVYCILYCIHKRMKTFIDPVPENIA